MSRLSPSSHVHWVVIPESEAALAQAFHAVDTKYAGRANVRRRRSGHFYQGRFFSSPLDDEYLWAAVRYAERNPVRAGIVAQAEEYEWSSAGAHCGLRLDPLLTREFPPPGVIDDWRGWLATESEEQTEPLRRHTFTGRPCGSESFVARLEARLQRVLRPQKRGPRPTAPVAGQGEFFT